MDKLAIIGAITGTVGLLISLLNYLRDAPRIRVFMRFDMSGFGTVPDELHCVIVIANAGRRTIYLQHPHIPPLARGEQTIIFAETLAHITLAEGAQPYVISIRQEGLEDFGADRHWWRMRAKVWDAAGRLYASRWPVERPSFATVDAPPIAILTGRLFNIWADLRLRLLA